MRRFPGQYIDSVKSPDGRVLRSNRKIRDAFGTHFHDSFPRSRFRGFAPILPTSLGAAEATGCEGVITECKVRDALKQVGLNNSPGLDGLPYEVYLRLSHMFVPILVDMFNHWFAQGAIPGSVTKGVITLLKKGGKHVWESLDNYRPITLLNTELKILARVLANRLQIVISDLIGPEQTYDVKGRSILDNQHLIREVLERIEDGTEAALIGLTIGFWRLFWRLLDSNRSSADGLAWCTPTSGAGERKAFGGIRDRAFGPAGLSPVSSSLCPHFWASTPWAYVWGDKSGPARYPFCWPSYGKGSAFADDITVFVSNRLDIKAVKKVVSEYERIAGAKVNFDKSESLQLGAWRGSNTLPGPFRWSDGPVCILRLWFGPEL